MTANTLISIKSLKFSTRGNPQKGHTQRPLSETIASDMPVKTNRGLIQTPKTPPDFILIKTHLVRVWNQQGQTNRRGRLGLWVFLWAAEGGIPHGDAHAGQMTLKSVNYLGEIQREDLCLSDEDSYQDEI